MSTHPVLTGTPGCQGKPSWPWFALPVERGDHGGPAPRQAKVEAATAHRKAVATCVQCPILLECLRWGSLNEDHGVWGGVAAWERAGMGCKGAGLPGRSPMTPGEVDDLMRARFGDRADDVLAVMAEVAAELAARRKAA